MDGEGEVSRVEEVGEVGRLKREGGGERVLGFGQVEGEVSGRR